MALVPDALRLHGDTMVAPGHLDFAVNVVPGGPPSRLRDEIVSSVDCVSSYPDERPAALALADLHGRAPDEILPTNGSAEAFWLLAQALRPRRAVCVHPSFTEAEVALRAAGREVERVFRERDSFRLCPEAIPAEADLVVVGNPNNPTGNLDPAEKLASLAKPGRVLVVDEAFMEFVPGEGESLAARADLPGLVVVRSLTKLWSLPGLRAGYVIGPGEVIAALRPVRQPWSVNALACTALVSCARDRSEALRRARDVSEWRDELARGLRSLPGVRVWPSYANFLLLRVPHGASVRAGLLERRIAVRRADTFPGLGTDHVRVAVRTPDDNRLLLCALREIL